jgi:hypothetical protein
VSWLQARIQNIKVCIPAAIITLLNVTLLIVGAITFRTSVNAAQVWLFFFIFFQTVLECLPFVRCFV